MAAEVWERVQGHVFEGAVALASCILGLTYLVTREAVLPPPGEAPSRVIWSALYTVGGPLVLASLVQHDRDHWRVAGLVLLATGFTMQGVWAFAQEPRAALVFYFVYALACALRALVLVRMIRRGEVSP